MAQTDPPASNGASSPPQIGPHPGFISAANQYTTESHIRRKLRDNGCDPAREVTYRIQGVQLIDNVREYLRLPVRTFDTACVYFHKFRLNFRDAEYNYQDAALASLFVACKVEDTIKKSRDILAAAYNVKNPEKPTASDDKMFENPGKIVIGLERLILETIGFDFRTRYPQKLLVKVLRRVLLTPSPSSPTPDLESARKLFSTAYAMSIDLYKTFAPIKRTSFAMAMAVAELTARIVGGNAHVLERLKELAVDKAQMEMVTGSEGSVNGGGVGRQQRYSRGAVTETMLDLLDLYVQNGRSTKIGVMFDQNRFIDIKIQVNNTIESDNHPRHLHQCTRCEDPNTTSSTPNTTQPLTPASTTSPASTSEPTGTGTGRRTTRGQDGTVRFVFDPEIARGEKDAAARYFNEEWEEYEVEVDEPVPPPPRREDDMGRGRGGRGRGRGGGFHRGRGDHRWEGPYGGFAGRGRGGRGRYHH